MYKSFQESVISPSLLHLSDSNISPMANGPYGGLNLVQNKQKHAGGFPQEGCYFSTDLT